MEKKAPKIQLLFMLLIAVIAWTGVALQFYLARNNWPDLGLSSLEGTFRFFSYFTILTNIIVALSLTVSLLKPSSGTGRFFYSTDTQTAIAMYIFVVGIVYNLILRTLWSPKGLQLIVDNILHSIVPVLFTIYWIVYVPVEKMKFSRSINWLWYPGLYFLWVILFGSLTKFYPYPFIDANVIGYTKMLVHATVLLIVFILLGSIAIAIKRNVGRKIIVDKALS